MGQIVDIYGTKIGGYGTFMGQIEKSCDITHTCCECAFWNIAFDNSCTKRALFYGDWSNQPPEQPACEYFEKEEL